MYEKITYKTKHTSYKTNTQWHRLKHLQIMQNIIM